MINLLPTDVKKARMYGRRNRRLVSYSIGVVTIGLIAISITLFNMQNIANDQKQIKQEMALREAEVANLEKSQKEVEAIAGQLKTIDKLYSGEVKFSELIPKIGALLPNGVVLNALTLTGGKSSPLQLDIDMDQQNLAAVLQQNLVKSDLFDAVDISAITTKGATTSKPGQRVYPYGATLVASFKGSVKKPVTKATGGAQ